MKTFLTHSEGDRLAVTLPFFSHPTQRISLPLIESQYRPTRPWYRNAHLNTIAPALLRRVNQIAYRREVLELDDGDFLDLDWLDPPRPTNRLVIVLHGLEGSADRPYVRGMCRRFNLAGYAALGLNQRTCGGRPNRLLRAYHLGVTDDLHRVVRHANDQGYDRIALVGFSMGGNQLLKYFGEFGSYLPAAVRVGVAFSVPCHLVSANVEIDKPRNRLYLNRFLRSLNQKIEDKRRQWPDHFGPCDPIPRNFYEFDDRYTGPLHGFTGAHDYWTRSSARQFIGKIKRPCLLVNALDDTFLSTQCYPRDEARSMPNFYLETPRFGGHVGFAGPSLRRGSYWSEERALAFVEQHLGN